MHTTLRTFFRADNGPQVWLLGGGLWSVVIHSPVFARRRTTHHTIFFGLLASEKPVGTGLPTVPMLEHSGGETLQKLLLQNLL